MYLSRVALSILLLVTTLIGTEPLGAQTIQQSLAATGASGGSGYTGLGNVVSSWSAWWGLRGYSSSYTGNALRTRRASDSAESDISILLGGALDTNTLYSFCAGTTCTVTTLYDQTGNGFNLLQATAGSQPSINLSNVGIGGRPSVSLISGKSLVSSATWTQAVPISVYATISPIISSGTRLFQSFGSGTTNAIRASLVSGTTNSCNISNNSLAVVGSPTFQKNDWITCAGVMNGASSSIFVNGNKTTGTMGVVGAVANTFALGPTLTGNWVEGGWYAGTIADADFTSLNSNARQYWGF